MSEHSIVKGDDIAEVDAEQSLVEVRNQYEKLLESYDSERKDGVSLTKIWRDALRVHDDNAILRTNMLQLEIMAQDLHTEWLEKRKEEDSKAARRLLDAVTHLSAEIRQVRKEIRSSEFQSKFYVHLNDVQVFMSGMTAILFKYIRDKKVMEGIVKDMGLLSKTLRKDETWED